jgi:REP element-mobilizing transposase RayT
LTILTRRRERFFERAALADICIAQFRRAGDRKAFRIRAGSVMPDHVHLLVQGTTTAADLTAFVKLAKQLSGYHMKRETGRRLWADGYYDRVVRHDEDPRSYIEYILRNPVTAGITVAIGLHPHTWSDEATPAPQ